MKIYQVKLTLEGTAEQIEHTLLALVRSIQVQIHYSPEGKMLSKLCATGYEDIVVYSELKEL